MTLKVIGAGLGRTGTHSLALALERLGFGPCYHILEVNKNAGHLELWTDALDGKTVDWNKLFDSYVSSVEWPAIAFIPQVFAAFPEAKVILTLRDSEDWFASAIATIFPGLESSKFNPNPRNAESNAFKRRLILDTVFSGRYRDKAFAIEVYERHNRQVMDLVPPDQLLQYRVTEGWELLCSFLDKPVPDEPFPRKNDRESFIAQAPEWARKNMDSDSND